ncbi:MAG: DUF5671 domain-containing protein [Anaerolineales bacterium]|nr:DUF5671 domain-containing protein [Anaerolineales bacterium]
MLNFYLYSITAISLAAFYTAAIIAVNGFLRLAFNATQIPGDQEIMEGIAAALGFLLIALPIWWLHWRWLRVEFTRAEGSAVSWHRFYLFTIVCLNALAILLIGSMGITGVMRIGLGIATTGGQDFARTGVFLFALLLSTLLWVHHWGQFKGGRGELHPPKAEELEVSPQSS